MFEALDHGYCWGSAVRSATRIQDAGLARIALRAPAVLRQAYVTIGGQCGGKRSEADDYSEDKSARVDHDG
jgi:hypothetical protein